MLDFFLSFQRFFVLDNGMLKYSKSPIDVSRLEDFKTFREVQSAHTHSRHIYESTHMKVVDEFKEIV